MKKLKYALNILLSLLILFSSSACSTQKAPYSDDFDILWNELENSYPYYSYINNDLNIDLDEIHTRYKEKSATVSNEDDFSLMLCDMFSEMNNIGHLDFVTSEMYVAYSYLYSNYDNPFSRILNNKNLSEKYTADINANNNLTDSENNKAKVLPQYFSDGNILYLKIISFAEEFVERDRKLITDALKKYPDTKNIIVDIEDNAGGSDNYWIKNIVEPLGGKYEYSFRSFFKASSTTDSYYNDYPYIDIPSDSPEWVRELSLDRCLENTIIISDETSDKKSVSVWLLTNETVFSSADKFASFCKATGFATVVGTRTAGDGLGSTPILLLLPNSGLLVRFSATAGENPDGSMNAVSGTAPDIFCIKNKTALDTCIELIREK